MARFSGLPSIFLWGRSFWMHLSCAGGRVLTVRPENGSEPNTRASRARSDRNRSCPGVRRSFVSEFGMAFGLVCPVHRRHLACRPHRLVDRVERPGLNKYCRFRFLSHWVHARAWTHLHGAISRGAGRSARLLSPAPKCDFQGQRNRTARTSSTLEITSEVLSNPPPHF